MNGARILHVNDICATVLSGVRETTSRVVVAVDPAAAGPHDAPVVARREAARAVSGAVHETVDRGPYTFDGTENCFDVLVVSRGIPGA